MKIVGFLGVLWVIIDFRILRLGGSGDSRDGARTGELVDAYVVRDATETVWDCLVFDFLNSHSGLAITRDFNGGGRACKTATSSF